MKNSIFFTIFSIVLLFSATIQAQGQFKVRNDAFIQIGYSGYKTLTFGQETINSPNNGKFALEYCATCTPAGFNVWKPWPTASAANYLLYIRDNGFVGIGNAGDNSYRLNVFGGIKCTTLFQTSDKRLKTNIVPLTTALSNINSLKTYQYSFIPEATTVVENVNENKEAGAYNLGLDDKKHFGLMAQDLEAIFPHLVSKDEKGYASINYIELIPVLIKSIQELDAKVEALEKIIEKQKK